MKRITGILAWLVSIIGLMSIVWACFLLAHLLEHSRMVFPDNLGNERATALLSKRNDQSDLLKFAIVGDINNGTETFEAVIARVLEEKDVAFLVLLGDCAADPKRNLHTYFIDEFSETKFHLPTFIVAGNHDVRLGKFEYSEFENLYGPANFAFNYHNYLFIGLGAIHDREKRLQTLFFLEKTLQEKQAQTRKVFVFMHIAPKASEDIPTDIMEYSERFVDLFEQYKVDYVFSGHYHRLARTEVNGTVYLVTGSGGARLRHDRFEDIGLFHHTTIIQIHNSSVAEHVIPIKPAGFLSRTMERIERLGITEVMPAAKQHLAISGIAVIAGIVVFIWGVVDRCRRLRYKWLEKQMK